MSNSEKMQRKKMRDLGQVLEWREKMHIMFDTFGFFGSLEERVVCFCLNRELHIEGKRGQSTSKSRWIPYSSSIIIRLTP